MAWRISIAYIGIMDGGEEDTEEMQNVLGSPV
jgi:hypothetical protein